jgi:hypothetical protein
MGGGVDRARADIAEGRLWKARERLLGVVRSAPHCQEVLGLLGEVYFAMGDHPAAGRFWALTARDDADAERAIAALEEHTHTRRELLRALPIKPPLDAYPPQVQSRIDTLRAETGWDPEAQADEDDGERSFLRRVGDGAAIAIVLLFTFGVWLLGLFMGLGLLLYAIF